MERTKTLSVALPTDDDGMLPRQCPTCERHFGVDAERYGEGGYLNLRCPYCKWIAPSEEFTTHEQNAYVQALAENEARQMTEDFLDDALEEMFRGVGSSPHVRIERTSERPHVSRAAVPSPFPRVELADVKCGTCDMRFSALVGTASPNCPVCR